MADGIPLWIAPERTGMVLRAPQPGLVPVTHIARTQAEDAALVNALDAALDALREIVLCGTGDQPHHIASQALADVAAIRRTATTTDGAA